jgi:ATP-binding cassette subfamily B protein
MPRFASRLNAEELREAGIDRATLRRAWHFAKPYRRRLVLYAFVIVGSTLLALLPPLVFKALLDAVDAKGGVSPDVRHRINLLFVAAIVLAIGMTTVQLFSRWLGSQIGEGLIYDMRLALYEKVQRMPLAFFTRTQTGALLSRLSNDVIGAQSTVGTAATVFSDVLTLLSVLATMLVLSWRVTLLALLIVPVFVVLDRVLGKRLAAMSRQRMTLNSDMSSTMTERFNVAGALLVKLFGRPAAELDTFADRAAAVRDTGVRIAIVSRLYYGTLALAGALGTAAVYWFGGRAVLTGSISIGTLSALAAYVTRLYSPLTDLASARTDLLTAFVSFDRCFEVLDAPEAIHERPDAVPLLAPTGLVSVEHVTFRYPAPAEVSVASLEAGSPSELSSEPGEIVLHDVSFTAEPGHTVALVGPSGAGKTTLTSLLPRLYDVTEGAVRIDGHDVRDLTLASLSSAIGVVSQDPHLFHDSIVANLRYAAPEASDAEIVAACRAARIHDVIASLPEGYDTVVGERGHRLSGGEKQRLSIARVLLKQPAVVVLDEATSHLDSENEAAIQAALTEALSGRTAIVIAHRLSTIVAADQILVLRSGRIEERGTHAELIDRDGLYRELFETQFATA